MKWPIITILDALFLNSLNLNRDTIGRINRSATPNIFIIFIIDNSLIRLSPPELVTPIKVKKLCGTFKKLSNH